MSVRVGSNLWLAKWRDSLRGMRPQAQSIGYWLAEQADDNGVVDGVDWDQLAEASGLSVNTLRRELRDHGDLITSGKVVREVRQLGNAYGATRYHLLLGKSNDN